MEYTSDEDFVREIRKGGAALERATDGLYRTYRDPALTKVKSYLRFRAGIEDDAVDVLQDAFLVMVDKIKDGGYNEGSLLHFWIGITRGLLRNKLKRDARTDLIEDNSKYDQADFESPEYLLLGDEKRQMLDRALSNLGERCKKVLLMWAGGYSMEEIAKALELSSEAMARKTKYKCKNQLMELLDSTDFDL
ncbi:MAG TPA: sigma-70 family RNA polymerase sigma factor [Saprospiraceae bacterium]|nr:sigma-70 family RNA polymerase sigma factor [Saprospiraceae bacterium]